MHLRTLCLAVFIAAPLAAQLPAAPAVQLGSILESLPPPSSGGILGRVVKNQPYSLLETFSTVKTLADGTHITHSSKTRRMRDSEGRTRTESIHEFHGEDRVDLVIIADPVARLSMTLMPRNKQARVTQWPASAPAQPLHPVEPAVKPPSEPVSTPTRSIVDASRKNKRETLGQREIAGVLAEGTRSTLTIPVGSRGNDREFNITMETWRSPDLGIILLDIQDDPENGVMTRSVSELQRGEPDASLFLVPADYKVAGKGLGSAGVE